MRENSLIRELTGILVPDGIYYSLITDWQEVKLEFPGLRAFERAQDLTWNKVRAKGYFDKDKKCLLVVGLSQFEEGDVYDLSSYIEGVSTDMNSYKERIQEQGKLSYDEVV